jgi:hypothetical protein
MASVLAGSVAACSPDSLNDCVHLAATNTGLAVQTRSGALEPLTKLASLAPTHLSLSQSAGASSIVKLHRAAERSALTVAGRVKARAPQTTSVLLVRFVRVRVDQSATCLTRGVVLTAWCACVATVVTRRSSETATTRIGASRSTFRHESPTIARSVRFAWGRIPTGSVCRLRRLPFHVQRDKLTGGLLSPVSNGG